MANRRMFSKVITNSDLFLNMPSSTQLLYFHLGMNADDDGFVQLRSVMRSVGAVEDDAKLLFDKGFLIIFESGVVIIRDWLVHNEIRSDRYKPTFYIEERKLISTDESKRYVLVVPNDNHLDTQVRLGKVRLGKEREKKKLPIPEKDISNKKNTEKELELTQKAQEVLKWFNNATQSHFRTIDPFRKNFEYWSNIYSQEDIGKAIIMIKRGKWWAKDPTLELLFRRRNPSGEGVDNIGYLLNIYTKEESYATRNMGTKEE